MEIQEFKPEDLDEINEWYEKRELPKFVKALCPKLGFIIHGVAAVFVYLTDSEIAIIEGLVSNPEFEKGARRDCIRRLVDHAYLEAKKQRSLVVVIIKNGWVQELAKNTGYKSLGKHEVLIRG